jgi:hypothetical protein
LAHSSAGILVLSPAFIAKPWPKRELAGLNARQLAHATRLIPIWHGLQIDEVINFSPPLADIKALHSSAGIESMIRELSAVVKGSSSSKFDQTIETAQHLLKNGRYGAYDAAIKMAFIAFDARLIGRIDRLRELKILPPDFRIHQYPGAAWEAVETLTQLNELNVPAVVDLEFLKEQWDCAIGRWSFAGRCPSSEETAVNVVSQAAALLRANPIQQ